MTTLQRTKMIPVKVTPAEKALLEQRAKSAGLNVSEFLRREGGIPDHGRSALRGGQRVPSAAGPSPAQVDVKASPEFTERVKKKALLMPRRAAENVVRREMEAEAS